MNENFNMRQQLARMEQERAQIWAKGSAPSSAQSGEMNDIMTIKQGNTQLQKRIEFLQKREKDLLEHLIKAQNKAK